MSRMLHGLTDEGRVRPVKNGWFYRQKLRQTNFAVVKHAVLQAEVAPGRSEVVAETVEVSENGLTGESRARPTILFEKYLRKKDLQAKVAPGQCLCR